MTRFCIFFNGYTDGKKIQGYKPHCSQNGEQNAPQKEFIDKKPKQSQFINLTMTSFQLKEINAISPSENEDVKLEKELNILENAEKAGFVLQAENNKKPSAI